MTLTQLLTNIANKIREIKGTSAPIVAEDFTDEMEGMVVPTGTKNITQNGTTDVTNYATANVNVSAPAPNLQSKDITITTNGTQTVTADSGYDGLSDVDITVNVSSGGGGKNIQYNNMDYYRDTVVLSPSGSKLSVAKTGTYTIKYLTVKDSTSGTYTSALYKNGTQIQSTVSSTWGATAIRNLQQWTNTMIQIQVHTGVQLSENDEIEVYVKSRASGYWVHVYYLLIEEE